MICSRCIRRAAGIRPTSSITRAFASSTPRLYPIAPAATSTSAAQPFSTPLTPSPSSEQSKPKPKTAIIPASSCPEGTPLRGLNYLKGRDDPVALKEEEYPEWLWRCLEVRVKDGDGDEGADQDLFAKSKKLRRRAAKRLRKTELARLAAGDTSLYDPKIPMTQQSIDLPSNEQNTIEGALEAVGKREELTEALRRERRSKIKETNYLKSM